MGMACSSLAGPSTVLYTRRFLKQPVALQSGSSSVDDNTGTKLTCFVIGAGKVAFEFLSGGRKVTTLSTNLPPIRRFTRLQLAGFLPTTRAPLRGRKDALDHLVSIWSKVTQRTLPHDPLM